MSQLANPASQLTLVLPGLIWPQQAMRDLTHDLATPALCTLLGKGELASHPDNQWLLDAFGLMQAPPAAPLRVLGHGGIATQDRWLCLDPINLAFVERSIRVGNPGALQLTEAEAQSLCNVLAPTFAALGELLATTPDQWHLRMHHTAPPLPDFAALTDCIGGRADQALPADAFWRQLLNDTQVMLHDHPVNLAREASGQVRVNSLWPWGGGTLPAQAKTSHDVVFGEGAVIQGLAKLCGVATMPTPNTWQPNSDGNPLVILSPLERPRHQGDGLRWREALAELDVNWFAPLLSALRHGELRHLKLIAPETNGGRTLNVSRASLLKFWRRQMTLSMIT